MKPDDIKQWLRDDEIQHSGVTPPKINIGLILERLAACRERSEQRRVLMVKHQYDSFGMGLHQCRECKASPVWYSKEKYPPCKPDCLWARAIEKGE